MWNQCSLNNYWMNIQSAISSASSCSGLASQSSFTMKSAWYRRGMVLRESPRFLSALIFQRVLGHFPRWKALLRVSHQVHSIEVTYHNYQCCRSVPCRSRSLERWSLFSSFTRWIMAASVCSFALLFADTRRAVKNKAIGVISLWIVGTCTGEADHCAKQFIVQWCIGTRHNLISSFLCELSHPVGK